MSTGTLAPDFVQQFLDANGNPLNGGSVTFYAAGTTTLQDTFSNVTLVTANPNPIVMNSAGRPSVSGTEVSIYFTPGTSYKALGKNSAGVTQWTRDNIGAVPPSTVDVDIPITAGENLAANDAFYISDGSGGKTAGRAYKADSTNTYSSSLAATVGFATAAITSASSGSGRIVGRLTGFGGLTVGATYYVDTSGAITATAPTNARPVGEADSISSLIVAPNPAPVSASPIVQTTTSTGTQNNFAVTAARRLVLYANNATALTLSGLTAGQSGDMIDLLAIGAGTVALTHQDAGSTAANRIITPTAGTTIVTGARLIYDTTTARWRLSLYTPTSSSSYATTLTNVISTAVQTTYLSFSVPSMADGDVLDVAYSALKKNNKGTAGTVTIDVFYGAATVTQIAGSNWGNSATELKALGQFRLQRVGSDLWVQMATDVPGSVVSSDGAANVVVISAPTFTTAQTVSFKITLSASDATFYLKPQSAVVQHRRASQ